jgi:hypothetical protein
MSMIVCGFENVADIEITQRSSYPRGTSDQVAQLERDYYSYQSVHKHLFRMPGYNQLFESFVTDGEVYDFYYIQFLQVDSDLQWNPGVHMDEGVILVAPQGDESDDVSAVLTAFAGAPKDESGPSITTTTTTTAVSPTTTTTTTLIP